MERTRTRTDPWNWDAARAVCLRETSRLLRDRCEAEDAAQEAVLRAWRALERSSTVDSPNAWLRTIAGNEARRVWSREGPARTGAALLEGDGSASEAADVDESLGGLMCEQLLAALPRCDRDLVRLRFVDDLGYAEIAAAAGVPEATAKTRIHRSLARLRTLLSNEALG